MLRSARRPTLTMAARTTVVLALSAAAGLVAWLRWRRRRLVDEHEKERTIPLVDLSSADAAVRLNAAFSRHGFCVAIPNPEVVAAAAALRLAAYDFFALPEAEKARWDHGRGYGFGGYVARAENGAGLTGSFGRDQPDLVQSAQQTEACEPRVSERGKKRNGM